MKKNDIISITIDGLTIKGDGYATYNNRTIYIPNTLPQEQVKIKILKINPKHAFAKCLQVIVPHPLRHSPQCKIATQCGGCQLLHHHYNDHLNWKQSQLKHLFPNDNILSIKPSPDQFGFRNKGQFAFQYHPKHGIQIGLYARASHRVIDTENCDIQHPHINEVLTLTRSFFKQHPLTCYDDISKTGLLRYLVIRTTLTNQTMVILVTTSPNINLLDLFVSTLKRLDHIKSIYLNVNTSITDKILSNNLTLLWGNQTIEEKFNQTRFRISPHAFFQLNSKQAYQLYNDIKLIINTVNPNHILDLYCGTGTIGLFATDKSISLTGIELNKDAIEDAIFNAKLNNQNHTIFLQGKVEKIYPTLTVSPDCVILDPPRKGCNQVVLQTLSQHQPTHIIYISCNPNTLVYDLKYLLPYYEITQIQPYDMFPFTPHIEVMVVLKRNGIASRDINN